MSNHVGNPAVARSTERPGAASPVVRGLRRAMVAALALLVVGPIGALVAGSPADGERVGPPIPRKILEGTPETTSDTRAASDSRFSPVLPPSDYKPSEIHVVQERYNFGTVFKGEEIVHEFTVENKGGSDLILQKIKPGCGCTYVKHDSRIPPGESGIVTLKLATARLPAGKASKYADIYSNDPKNSRKRVYLDGKIATAFEYAPAYPRLDILRGDENSSLNITLKKSVNMPFTITGVKALNNRVQPELKPTADGGKTYELVVKPTSDPSGKTAYFSDRVVIEVEGDGKKMSQDIPVVIRLKERISVKPPRTVYFRRPEVQALKAGSGPVAKEVVVKSEVPGDDHTFNITEVEISESRFKATVEPVREGKEYRITVTIDSLPEDPSVKSVKGDMIIHTDDPSQPTISMRVLAFI